MGVGDRFTPRQQVLDFVHAVNQCMPWWSSPVLLSHWETRESFSLELLEWCLASAKMGMHQQGNLTRNNANSETKHPFDA